MSIDSRWIGWKSDGSGVKTAEECCDIVIARRIKQENGLSRRAKRLKVCPDCARSLIQF
jgi:hypothetical protein